MDTELRRPVAAFIGVSVLCVVLLTVSAGRVDAVLGVFDAPRPISAPASAPRLAPTAELPSISVVETVPEELTAFRVGSATGATDESTDDTDTDTRAPAVAPRRPQSAAPGRSGEHTAAKAAKKADHEAAKTAKKADHRAAKAARKADREAAKAAKKADKGPEA